MSPNLLPSALAFGLRSAIRHRRLAAILWLASLVAVLPAGPALLRATARWDDGPFREAILKGWDGWAILSWFSFQPGEASILAASLGFSIACGTLLHLLLVPGVLRALVADVRRPVLRRVVAESADLFRPNLWGSLRYLLTLAFWSGLLVALPVAGILKLKGEEAPPNGLLDDVALAWGLVSGIAILTNVSLRWSLARVALARVDSPTARGAFRVAKARLRGARPRAAGIWLFWLVLGILVQVSFTNLGVALNPGTGPGVVGLFLVRQTGFFLLAMTRVGYWASLLEFERSSLPVVTAPVAAPLGAWQTGATESVPSGAPGTGAPEPVPEG